MKERIKRRGFIFASLLPFLVLVIGFEVLPLLGMIYSSFQSDDGQSFTLMQYETALANKFYWKGITNSILISLGSSVIGIVVSLIAAYSVTKMPERIQSLFLLFSNMTSNFAGVPLAFAYIILLGNNGLFTLLFHKLGWSLFANFDLYSWTGLMLVYVYFQVPLGILLLYPTYSGIHKAWREAASLLGANARQFWVHIGFPVILPGVVGTFSILFANAMGAYATAYALVGSNYNLLATRIGSLIAGDVFARPQLGSALAVLLALTMIFAMLFNEKMMNLVRRDLK